MLGQAAVLTGQHRGAFRSGVGGGIDHTGPGSRAVEGVKGTRNLSGMVVVRMVG